jgi:cyclopropane fatty-acyl-phospholipid synthase-like methyltransferase
MDKNRYSYIAHGELPVWNPLAVSHLQSYVSKLALPEGSRILDIGCGRGHALKLILSQYNVRGVGVDSSPLAVAQAAKDTAPLVEADRLHFVEKPFKVGDYEPGSFDLVLCIGSTHAAGGYQQTLRESQQLLGKSGMLLVGEGYWKCSPEPGYLAFLRMSEDEHLTHEGNQSTGINEGYELLECSECSQEEWDAYEEQYARNVENFVSANVGDSDSQAMLQRIRPWNEAYRRWGRSTLGFGLYLFRARPR